MKHFLSIMIGIINATDSLYETTQLMNMPTDVSARKVVNRLRRKTGLEAWMKAREAFFGQEKVSTNITAADTIDIVMSGVEYSYPVNLRQMVQYSIMSHVLYTCQYLCGVCKAENMLCC